MRCSNIHQNILYTCFTIQTLTLVRITTLTFRQANMVNHQVSMYLSCNTKTTVPLQTNVLILTYHEAGTIMCNSTNRNCLATSLKTYEEIEGKSQQSSRQMHKFGKAAL